MLRSSAGRRFQRAGTAPDRRVALLTVGLLVLCVPLLLALDGAPLPWAVLALVAGAVVLAELRPVHIGRGSQRHAFTVTEGPLAAAVAMQPSVDVVGALMVGMLVAQLVRRMPWWKTSFTVAQMGVASAVAALTVEHVGGLHGTVLGVLLFTLISDRLVRIAISLTTRQPVGRPLQDASLGWLLYMLTVGSVGYLAAQVSVLEPSTLLAFVAPALLATWLQDQSNKRRAMSNVVSALAAQATSFYGRNSEESALLVMRTAREVLGAARAELVLLGEESVVTITEDIDGVRRWRLPHAELVTGWRGRVFETTAAQAHGDWAGTVIGRDVPHALLGIWRDVDQGPFRASDVALLQTMADSVGEWLSTEEGEASPVDAMRRRLLDLGGDLQDVADALATLALVRERLAAEGATAPANADLATDLRDVEERVVGFLGALMVEQRTPSDQLVATGRWRTP